MHRLTRCYGLNHAHFITTSTYRRARLFDSELFRHIFVRALGDVRDSLNFKLIGYVLMPEHFHLRPWPSAEPNPSAILQSLKVRTAMKVLRTLREHQAQPRCGRVIDRLRLAAAEEFAVIMVRRWSCGRSGSATMEAVRPPAQAAPCLTLAKNPPLVPRLSGDITRLWPTPSARMGAASLGSATIGSPKEFTCLKLSAARPTFQWSS